MSAGEVTCNDCGVPLSNISPGGPSRIATMLTIAEQRDTAIRERDEARADAARWKAEAELALIDRDNALRQRNIAGRARDEARTALTAAYVVCGVAIDNIRAALRSE